MRSTTAELLSANLVDAPMSGWICMDWARWTALLRIKGNRGAGAGHACGFAGLSGQPSSANNSSAAAMSAAIRSGGVSFERR
jgi:hypothetical protein